MVILEDLGGILGDLGVSWGMFGDLGGSRGI